MLLDMDREFAAVRGESTHRARAAVSKESEAKVQAPSRERVPDHFSGTDQAEFEAWREAFVDQRLREAIPKARADAYAEVMKAPSLVLGC